MCVWIPAVGAAELQMNWSNCGSRMSIDEGREGLRENRKLRGLRLKLITMHLYHRSLHAHHTPVNAFIYSSLIRNTVLLRKAQQQLTSPLTEAI